MPLVTEKGVDKTRRTISGVGHGFGKEIIRRNKVKT